MRTIDISNWKEFAIADLFDVVKGTRLTRANMKSGSIRYIGASTFNNGITAYIANDEHLHPANTISVSYNGSVGVAFYQDEPFWASDDVNILYPKFPLTQNIALFLIPIIQRVGNQLKGFLVFRTGKCIIFRWLNITVPKFFKNSHFASSM